MPRPSLGFEVQGIAPTCIPTSCRSAYRGQEQAAWPEWEVQAISQPPLLRSPGELLLQASCGMQADGMLWPPICTAR